MNIGEPDLSKRGNVCRVTKRQKWSLAGVRCALKVHQEIWLECDGECARDASLQEESMNDDDTPQTKAALMLVLVVFGLLLITAMYAFMFRY